jgi:hypothetical protein
MINPLCFEDLRAALPRQVDHLPDCRTGHKTRSRIPTVSPPSDPCCIT